MHSLAEAQALVAPYASHAFASAPCLDVSTAGHSTDWQQKVQIAHDSSWEASETIQEYVSQQYPASVTCEQASGMTTHHPKAHEAFNSGLLQLPYACWQPKTDATDLGAPIHRSRIGWWSALIYCESRSRMMR